MTASTTSTTNAAACTSGGAAKRKVGRPKQVSIPNPIVISLNDECYKKAIVKHGKRVYAGKAGTVEERDELFNRLKSLGGGWLKFDHSRKTYLQVSDGDASKSEFTSFSLHFSFELGACDAQSLFSIFQKSTAI